MKDYEEFKNIIDDLSLCESAIREKAARLYELFIKVDGKNDNLIESIEFALDCGSLGEAENALYTAISRSK